MESVIVKFILDKDDEDEVVVVVVVEEEDEDEDGGNGDEVEGEDDVLLYFNGNRILYVGRLLAYPSTFDLA